MSYNGSGTFNINSTGQPVVAGTVITATAFNALTADLATGLTTAITKDGQTTTTVRIPFAQGISSTLVTDSSSTSTGSIITDGGVGIAKNLYVGGTLNVTGGTSFTNPTINNIKMGYSTTATAGGSTSLTVSSNYRQFFTGTLAQTIVLPVTSTLVTGMAYEIENNSTGTLTVNSSGGNLVGTIPAGVCAHAVCIGTTLTTAADWDWDYISTSTITGTGANVLATSPTITTPTLASANITTALTLSSAAGTSGQYLTSGGSGAAPTWSTVASSQWTTSGTSIYYNTGSVGIGTATPGYKLETTGSIFANGIELGANGDSIKRAGDMYLITTGANNLIFRTNNTERARIDANAYFLVGGTSVAAMQSGTAGFYAKGGSSIDSGFCAAATSAIGVVGFFNPNGGVGSIQTSGTSTIYNTGSDYRLKENIQPMTNALAKVAQLKPCTYKWKCDGSDGEGFIAHELAEVFPIAVSGEKDAMETYTDADGNEQTRPKWQGIDTSFLVGALTGAIQELKALNDTQAATITALTARITALENA